MVNCRGKLSVVFCLTLIIASTMVLFSGGIFAQTQADDRIVVHKSDLPPDLLAQLEREKTVEQIEQIGEWAGKGREVGVAVNEALKAITTNTVEFSKTDLGKYTMFLVAWKVMGRDFVQLIISFLSFLIFAPFWIWSFKKHCLKEDAIADVQWSHVAVLGVFILLLCLIALP